MNIRQAFGSQTSLNTTKADIPFYINTKSGKTSAEIIEEAKATIIKVDQVDNVGGRSMAVKTIDTKRPFTPRQTDRRLYQGSTNHVARPPSSFRLRPLPEEDFSNRPVTAGVKLSPLSARLLNSEINGEEKLPTLLPQLPKSAQVTRRRSPKDKRNPFRSACSLSDLVEEQNQDLAAGGPDPFEGLIDRVENSDSSDGSMISHKSSFDSSLDSEAVIELQRKAEKHNSNIEPIPFLQTLEHELKTVNKKTKKKQPPSKAISFQEYDKPAETAAKSAEELILSSLLDSLRNLTNDKNSLISKLQSLYSFILDSDNPKFFSKKRSEIIKVLGNYIETDNAEILIHLVQILLSINVRKQNLSTAYKLVYKVAKEAENDQCFLNSDTLELIINSIGGACPIMDAEALVYGYGALKFLTMNPATRVRLQKMGVLDLVLLHLKLINEAKLERKIPDETSHVLFQLTGVLRNLVNDINSQRKLVVLKGIPFICKCLELFLTDLDIVCNIARTLSILSSNDQACNVLSECTGFDLTCVSVLRKYPGRQDIVVRLTYCLGNLMAKCDEARPFFDRASGHENMDILLDLLHTYKNKNVGPRSEVSVAMKLESEDDHGSSGNFEDVVIKIIRVFANMSINPEVGNKVASMSRVYDHLTDILSNGDIHENEELILSTLATLNNLTYYPVDTGNKDGQDSYIYTRVEPYISCGNLEAQIEASRVLGNLTRSTHIRDQVKYFNILFIPL